MTTSKTPREAFTPHSAAQFLRQLAEMGGQAFADRKLTPREKRSLVEIAAMIDVEFAPDEPIEIVQAPPALTQWQITYQRTPTNFNPPATMVVEAATAAEAKELCRDALRRRGYPVEGDPGVFANYMCIEAIRPMPQPPAGRVVAG